MKTEKTYVRTPTRKAGAGGWLASRGEAAEAGPLPSPRDAASTKFQSRASSWGGGNGGGVRVRTTGTGGFGLGAFPYLTVTPAELHLPVASGPRCHPNANQYFKNRRILLLPQPPPGTFQHEREGGGDCGMGCGGGRKDARRKIWPRKA